MLMDRSLRCVLVPRNAFSAISLSRCVFDWHEGQVHCAGFVLNVRSDISSTVVVDAGLEAFEKAVRSKP